MRRSRTIFDLNGVVVGHNTTVIIDDVPHYRADLPHLSREVAVCVGRLNIGFRHDGFRLQARKKFASPTTVGAEPAPRDGGLRTRELRSQVRIGATARLCCRAGSNQDQERRKDCFPHRLFTSFPPFEQDSLALGQYYAVCR